MEEPDRLALLVSGLDFIAWTGFGVHFGVFWMVKGRSRVGVGLV